MASSPLSQRVAAIALSVFVLGSGIVLPVAATAPAETEPSPTTSSPAGTGPEASPSAQPAASPAPAASPSGDDLDPADEVLELRTAVSQTYEVAPGRFMTDTFSSPVFHRPEGSSDWLPIDATLREVSEDGVTARSERAPVTVSLRAVDHAAGFLTVEGADHSISFRLPAGDAPGRSNAAATVRDEGRRAEFAEFLPGGIGLRVFPRPDGVKSFLVLHEKPALQSFTFAISAPGLSASEEEDGSIAFRDAAGVAVAAIPAPYVLDSSDGHDDGYSAEAVALDLGGTRAEPTVTISVDPKYLEAATYPVFVDPTVTVFGKDASSAIDTFISSTNVNVNYNGWTESAGTASLRIGYNSGNGSNLRALVRFPDIATTISQAHVDSAELKFEPYWQASGSTASPSYVRSVTSSWTAGSVTWNTAPSFIDDIVPDSANSTQGTDLVFDVTDSVQDIVDGTVAHHGYLVRGDGGDASTYKKLLAAESGDSDRPRLRVEWHRPLATPTDPTAGETTTSRTFTWSYSDNDTTTVRSQSHLRVQLSTSSSFATIVANGDSGEIAGTGTSWTLPVSASLNSGTTYHWRVKVKDGVGWSDWNAESFVAQAGSVTAEISAPAETDHRRGTFSIVGTAAGSDFEHYQLKWATGCVTGDPGHQPDSQATSILADPPSYNQVTSGALGSWNTGSKNGKHRLILTIEKLSSGLPAIVTRCIVVDNVSPTGSLSTPPLWGVAPVVGVATDTLGFKEYVVEWATGKGATSGWALVDPASPTFTTPVTEADAGAPLAMWDTTGKQGWYTVRLAVRDLAGNETVVTQDVYVENADRHLGAEPWFTSVAFDLGGDWSLSVGVDDGELALDRHLFEIPSYGPAQSMALHFGSLDAGTTQRLGTGWSSNLTQYLSFDTDLVTWHTATGERVPFTPAGSAWLPVLGHHETMTHTSGSYIITLPDQTKLVFAGTAPGRLQRMEDRFGNALTFAWSTSSATATDASGRSTTMAIDTNGRITGVTDSASRTWAFAYTSDELTTLTDPAGNATTIEYTSGSPTAIVRTRTLSGSPETIRWEAGYSTGKVTTVTDPLGLAASPVRRHGFSYASGSTTVDLLRDYDGGPTATTSYALDADGRVTSETDPRGFTTSRSFDAASNITSQTDPVTSTSFVTTTYEYDPRGNVTEIDAPFQGTTRTITRASITALNDPDSITVADGTGRAVVTDLGYTTGQLTSTVLDPGGLALETIYTYTANDQLLTETAPDGIVTRYEYDSFGNRTAMVQNYVAGQSATSDRNVRTEYAFNQSATAGSAGLVTSETDPLGRVRSYEYDALGRVTHTIENDVVTPSTSDEDVTTRTLYDEFGWAVASLDPRGFVTRSVTNRLGQVTKRISNCTDTGSTPSPTPTSCTGGGTHDSDTNVVIDMEYDASGNPVRETSHAASGDVATAHTYDAVGNRTQVVIDEGSGNLNLTKQWAYDPMGREVASRDAQGTITRSLYDDAGNLVQRVEDCTSSGTTVPESGWESCSALGTQDATWNLTTSWTYDERGNQLTETAPNGRVTAFFYDAGNRLTERVDNDVAGTPTGNEELITTYAYDDGDRQVGVRTPTADRTTFQVVSTEYDALGRVVRSIDSCTSSGTTVPATPVCTAVGTQDAETNVVTTSTYDAAGNQLSETAPSPAGTTGTDASTVTTRYAYDGAGRLCRVVESALADLQTLADPCATAISGTVSSNVSTRHGHDEAGNLTSMIDARGNTTTYAFDAAGRTISRTDPNGQTIAWQYDRRGNRTGQINRVGSPAVAITWTHDGANRVTSRTADGVTIYLTHDASGNRLASAGPDGTITSTFDRLGRVLTVDGADGADTSYTYSHTTPTRSDPSGAYTFTLDDFGREIGATTPLSQTPFTFAHRADGQPSQEVDPNGNETALAYDSAGRLLTKVTTGASGTLTRASYVYTYNRAGLRLSEASTISGDPAGGTASFTYDILGRLTAYTSPLGPSGDQGYSWQAVLNRATVTSASTTVTTTYDPADRPTTDSAGGIYGHDVDGRLTARPGQTLEWDSLGRLIKVRDAVSNSVLSEYTYDALDRLHTVDRSSGIIRFRYVGVGVQVAEVVDHNTSASQLKVANSRSGDRLADWTPASTRHYGLNGHRDTTWTADATGAVTGTIRYDPWGNDIAVSGSSLPEWRFQGSWFDDSVDHYWVITRWYDPGLGRFASEDEYLPTSRASDQHWYHYAGGDPIGGFDPNGRVTKALNFANSHAFTISKEGEAYVRGGRGILGAVAEAHSRINQESNYALGGLQSSTIRYTGASGRSIRFRIAFDWSASLDASVSTCCQAYSRLRIATHFTRIGRDSQGNLLEDRGRIVTVTGPITSASGPTSPQGPFDSTLAVNKWYVTRNADYRVTLRLWVYARTTGWADALADATISNVKGWVTW